MAIPITAAMRTAAAAPAVQFRTFVDVDTEHGIYKYATEAMSWAGEVFQGRLAHLSTGVLPLVGGHISACAMKAENKCFLLGL